jgi:phenylacetic acid degradation protein paaN
MMAFQAGGPHAQDRALEAIAYAWAEMKKIPSKALLGKAAGQERAAADGEAFPDRSARHRPRDRLQHVPDVERLSRLLRRSRNGQRRGREAASSAILPLALMVRIAREVLAENGFDPNVVTLAAHDAADDVAQKLALRPEVRLIDFTGSAANGNWLEANAKQAQVYTEKSGVNQIVVDSAEDFASVRPQHRVLAVALHRPDVHGAAEHLCAEGRHRHGGRPPFVRPGRFRHREAVQKLLGDPARAVEILGAVVNDGVMERLEKARRLGDVLLDTQTLTHPAFPQARIRTPLIVKLGAADLDKYLAEWFGPIAFVIATESTTQSLAIARDAVKTHGALTLSVYSRSQEAIDRAIEVAEDAGVALSINLTGGVFVNQSAAFSDFHGTGGEPGRQCGVDRRRLRRFALPRGPASAAL